MSPTSVSPCHNKEQAQEVHSNREQEQEVNNKSQQAQEVNNKSQQAQEVNSTSQQAQANGSPSGVIRKRVGPIHQVLPCMQRTKKWTSCTTGYGIPHALCLNIGNLKRGIRFTTMIEKATNRRKFPQTALGRKPQIGTSRRSVLL